MSDVLYSGWDLSQN